MKIYATLSLLFAAGLTSGQQYANSVRRLRGGDIAAEIAKEELKQAFLEQEEIDDVIEGEPLGSPEDFYPENGRSLQSAYADFCWKDSYGRGVGTPVDTCPSGLEKVGALCYRPCPSDYSRFGIDCHNNKSTYGRGGGYAVWHKKKCNKKHSQGCEKCLAMYYPKCRSGYHPSGCNLCRPNSEIIAGSAPKLLTCSSSKEYDAGLCYNKCRSGYNGVGPVCWAKVPHGWVDCALGAASSSSECAKATSDQVMSVGETALFFGSLGSSGSALPATATAKIAKLTAKFSKYAEIIGYLKEAAEFAEWAYSMGQIIDNAVKGGEMTEVDAVRLTAEIRSIFDATGVTSIVAAYTYDTCDKLAS